MVFDLETAPLLEQLVQVTIWCCYVSPLGDR
jgi:hypothetical protein